jgi:hypothetical protein
MDESRETCPLLYPGCDTKSLVSTVLTNDGLPPCHPAPSRSQTHWPRRPRFLTPGRGDPLHPTRRRHGHVPRGSTHFYHHAHRPLVLQRFPPVQLPPVLPVQSGGLYPHGEPLGSKLLHTSGLRCQTPLHAITPQQLPLAPTCWPKGKTLHPRPRV